MRFRQRTFRGLFPLFLVLLLLAAPALSQNLLVNPGFDRDLSGWDVRTYFNYTGAPGANATWAATNALRGDSGSVQFWLRGVKATVNRVLLSQCIAVQPGHRYTGGGLVRTDEQMLNGVLVRLELFASDGCTGSALPLGPRDGYSLVPLPYPRNDSGGRWLPASASAVADATARSVRFSFGLDAVTYGSNYTLSSFDGLFDDAFLVEEEDPAAVSFLPSAAKVSGAAGSVWTSDIALANPGVSDALVTLKFLGHDTDGRGEAEKALLVRGGTLVSYPDVLGTLFGQNEAYGALRISSSNAGLVLQSETSTPVPGGGSVGQALPALGPADFAASTPKTLAPIRENASFRTNLVLSNATEAPLTAHVVLYAADGTQIGSRNVDLPPLGMTQINRVASALGAATLDAGRLSVSTPTPGGLVAAYASVIDNTTNDPRTLLPQDVSPGSTGPSLLPSAASIFGSAGSHWTTDLTLANAGSSDASVSLRFFPSSGGAIDWVRIVPAGETLTLRDPLAPGPSWGPIRITATPPGIAVTAETSTPTAGGGTVGQALAAVRAADLIGAAPRSIAPVRDDSQFRTNLVLSNATGSPVTVHVGLFDASGALLGSRDVNLDSFGTAQIGGAGWALAGTSVNPGRLSVSTPTPGGLVAAYASVIDNVTNDPRTLLPRGGESGANLLSNGGFDRDDSGWKSTLSTLGSPAWSSSWVAADASGRAGSGGLALQASSDIHDGIVALRWQCVSVAGGSRVNFGAKFRTARQSTKAGSEIRIGFFPSADCGRYEDSVGGGSATSLVSPPSGDTTSNGGWLPAASNAAIPTGAQSMGVYVRAWASGVYGGPGPSSVGYLDAVVDDVFASVDGALPR